MMLLITHPQKVASFLNTINYIAWGARPSTAAQFAERGETDRPSPWAGPVVADAQGVASTRDPRQSEDRRACPHCRVIDAVGNHLCSLQDESAGSIERAARRLGQHSVARC